MQTRASTAVSETSARMLITVAAIALLVRLGGMILSQRLMPVIAADTGTYISVARSIAAGEGFSLDGSRYEASRIPPLFPLWLAALMQLTGSEGMPPLWIIGLGNVLLRTAGVVAVCVITSRYFGLHAAAGAAALYIIDPWEAMWVGYVLKESLAVALVLFAIWLLARADDRSEPRDYALAGAAIGIATLARWASGALWIAALILIWGRRHPIGEPRRMRATLALSVAMLAVLSPWLARNWRVTGQPVLSPHFVGQKLYTSNGPGVQQVTDGYYAPQGVNSKLIRGTPEQKAKPFNKDASLGRMTVGYMLQNPGELPRRIWSKLINMWRPTFEVHSTRNMIVLGIPYVLLMLISVIGLATAVRRRTSCAALAAPLVVFFLIHLVFRGEIRNRQFLMPLLYTFGGLAIAAGLERLRSRQAMVRV